jgi:hypothetical protein
MIILFPMLDEERIDPGDTTLVLSGSMKDIRHTKSVQT